MTDKTRQNWSLAGIFSIALALMTIGTGIWKLSANVTLLSAGLTKATSQHELILQQNAQIFQLVQQNSEEQLKILRRIEEKLDKRK